MGAEVIARERHCQLVLVSKQKDQSIVRLMKEEEIQAKVEDEKKKFASKVDIDSIAYESRMFKRIIGANDFLDVPRVHEVRFGHNIEDYDANRKIQKVRKYIEKGHHVKVSVNFRVHRDRDDEVSRAIITYIMDDLSDVINPNTNVSISMNGARTVLTPNEEIAEKFRLEKEAKKNRKLSFKGKNPQKRKNKGKNNDAMKESVEFRGEDENEMGDFIDDDDDFIDDDDDFDDFSDFDSDDNDDEDSGDFDYVSMDDIKKQNKKNQSLKEYYKDNESLYV